MADILSQFESGDRLAGLREKLNDLVYSANRQIVGDGENIVIEEIGTNTIAVKFIKSPSGDEDPDKKQVAKLVPCRPDDGTVPRYTTDDMTGCEGMVIKSGGNCYTVYMATSDETSCITTECGLEWSGPYNSCCECHGLVNVVLKECDNASADPITMTVQSANVPVGRFIRIGGVCYEVQSTTTCTTDAGDELPDDLQFVDCDTCNGTCWTLTLCGDSETVNVQSPNLSIGQVIEISGSCWTVTAAIENCTGTEVKIDGSSAITHDTCDDCTAALYCQTCNSGNCIDKTYAFADGTGATGAEATAAAKKNVVDAATAAAGSRGINICCCHTKGVYGSDPEYHDTAELCWSLCCPEGFKQVEVVTKVECVGGDIQVTTEKICVIDNGSCTEDCG